MKTTLPESITTVAEAKKFLHDLYSNNESFDITEDMFNFKWPNMEVQPTFEQRKKLDELLYQVSDLVFNNHDFDAQSYLDGLSIPKENKSVDTIEFTLEKAIEFANLYHKNLKEQKTTFIFERKEILVAFAKYLVEHLSSKFNIDLSKPIAFTNPNLN